jgi:4-hydroxy-tetrahydrodipicolinate synthase
MAGTGANSTSEAIELASFAKSAGADYSLSVVPYYNKPSQEGLFEHFRAIAEKVDMQHILYNVPGRTVASLSNDTILKLSAIDNIVGVKDATGDMVVGIDLLNRRPDDFLVFSGDDATFMALMMLGADGVISVTANVVPSLVQKICDHVGASEYQDARAANYLISDMNVALFLEANPIPVKWALAQMGKIKPNLRLPLTVLEQNLHTVVAASLRHAGVQVEFIQN